MFWNFTGDIAFRFVDHVNKKSAKRKQRGESIDSHVTVCDINRAMLQVGQQRAERLHQSSGLRAGYLIASTLSCWYLIVNLLCSCVVFPCKVSGKIWYHFNIYKPWVNPQHMSVYFSFPVFLMIYRKENFHVNHLSYEFDSRAEMTQQICTKLWEVMDNNARDFTSKLLNLFCLY